MAPESVVEVKHVTRRAPVPSQRDYV